MEEIIKYNKERRNLENKFLGLRNEQTTLIKSLITLADPMTGIVSDITYSDIAQLLKVNPAPGRKDSGSPSKQTIRNYIKSIERECGEYFKVISEGQTLKFLFPEIPKVFSKLFENREVNTVVNSDKPHENIEENAVFEDELNTDLNIEVNTPNHAVKKLFILNNKHNKQTQTANDGFPCSKKQIRDDFYPTPKTIEIALSMGLTKVTDTAEIQAFINHNKKLNTQWADFNPVFITWLERGAQHKPKKLQAQGQTRSSHNERGTNQSTLNPTALERVSQQHGISIESLWGTPSSEFNTCEFIEGTLVQSLDEADCNLRSAVYQ